MGEVIPFRPKPVPVVTDEFTAIIDWIKPPADWWTGQMQIQLAHHAYMFADYRRIMLCRGHGKDSPEAQEARDITRRAFSAWRMAGLRQIFIPAECVRHLRWKQEWLRRQGGAPETALAIARDQAALADRIEAAQKAVASRQATRKAVQR
ncbi:hypothetical protein EOA79_20275 [Mesorhizobium sp. M1A.F.Ca.IN.020.03.2.1]|uniref:hypothetical protein n=1 Tax=Mesorhizobium sp. M1A.F.Ca.IN.020.03.2.1 TaxID=2496769 RepID=UPI000FD2C4C1|nr:hypothetical protein [Mesorhizobium sp. M1A.F.Ca.IN.020.03.2.1]RUV00542.1 hypothetical protein EOA79_20275 [Mesorhizobium sp. M1A.F.Ca.IN.020.03.2.1]